jgi:CheY-like chemotaxis protein
MNRRILFIDDEENILDSFKKSYQNDFDITITSSPKKAIEILHSDNKFAAIVSDMRMNEMNGVDLLTTAKQLSPNSIRILLTAYADLNLALFAFNNDIIYRLIEKPCKKTELLNHLNNACAVFNASFKDKDIHDIIALIENGNYTKSRDNIDIVKIFEAINERHINIIKDKNLSIDIEFTDCKNSVIFDLFLLCDSLLFTIILESVVKESFFRAMYSSIIKFHIKIDKNIYINILGEFENKKIENSSWLSSYPVNIILKELKGEVHEDSPWDINDFSMKMIRIVLPIDNYYHY